MATNPAPIAKRSKTPTRTSLTEAASVRQGRAKESNKATEQLDGDNPIREAPDAIRGGAEISFRRGATSKALNRKDFSTHFVRSK